MMCTVLLLQGFIALVCAFLISGIDIDDPFSHTLHLQIVAPLDSEVVYDAVDLRIAAYSGLVSDSSGVMGHRLNSVDFNMTLCIWTNNHFDGCVDNYNVLGSLLVSNLLRKRDYNDRAMYRDLSMRLSAYLTDSKSSVVCSNTATATLSLVQWLGSSDHQPLEDLVDTMLNSSVYGTAKLLLIGERSHSRACSGITCAEWAMPLLRLVPRRVTFLDDSEIKMSLLPSFVHIAVIFLSSTMCARDGSDLLIELRELRRHVLRSLVNSLELSYIICGKMRFIVSLFLADFIG